MAIVEMLDDEGAVTEQCEAHVCVGNTRECETPAVCEDHGDTGSQENPVYAWTTADGMMFFACQNALATDDYARIKG